MNGNESEGTGEPRTTHEDIDGGGPLQLLDGLKSETAEGNQAEPKKIGSAYQGNQTQRDGGRQQPGGEDNDEAEKNNRAD